MKANVEVKFFSSYRVRRQQQIPTSPLLRTLVFFKTIIIGKSLDFLKIPHERAYRSKYFYQLECVWDRIYSFTNLGAIHMQVPPPKRR